MNTLPSHAIPWAKPFFWGREREYVADALASTWISGGSYLERLEREVAAFCGVSHALAVANGTMTLHLAYLAIGLKPGDEVVVPGFAFLAAANVALHLGARPVFAEVDPSTWCVRAEDIDHVFTPRTKAVVPVHFAGQACELDELLALAAKHQIALVEDAAHAVGA
ncbi:MAG TPA: DegT/DnrJ/EryC1/StrS aminotransferase family protein, partial [Candidatus Cybelea sp.]|nr:DegT/DnrJ/EryC1/StrS aminotransferase family protein [Candidatus Cybelea sp.]